MNFNTTYYDKDGDEVKSSKKIAQRYLRTNFLFDLLAAFPFHIFELKELQLISLIKLQRIARIKELLRRLNLSYRSKLFLRLLFFIILFPFVFHILTCVWNLIKDDFWISPLFWFDYRKAF